MGGVGAGRNVLDREFSVAVGDRVVRRVDDHDVGAHFGVHVAEDGDDSGFRERDVASLALGILSEVKFLGVVFGENVVEEVVAVWEGDGAAHGDSQDVRLKSLVFLDDAGFDGFGFGSVREPDDRRAGGFAADHGDSVNRGCGSRGRGGESE